MSLQDTELNISGIKFKGVYLAIGFTIISTISGFIYGFAEFMGRVDNLESQLESIVVPELAPLERRMSLVEENLAQSEIGTLQARLATLGANLETIMQQQQLLLDLRDRINTNTDIVEDNQILVESIERTVEEYEGALREFADEVDQLWEAFDAVSNPLAR